MRLDQEQESGQPGTDRFSLEGPSNPWGNGDGSDVGGGVGRMPPPGCNALETVRLLTLKEQQRRGLSVSTGAATPGSGGPGSAGRDDDGWEFQKSLLLSEYGEGERGVVDLMEKLITVSTTAVVLFWPSCPVFLHQYLVFCCRIDQL